MSFDIWSNVTVSRRNKMVIPFLLCEHLVYRPVLPFFNEFSLKTGLCLKLNKNLQNIKPAKICLHLKVVLFEFTATISLKGRVV
jgi:hypothetical protein